MALTEEKFKELMEIMMAKQNKDLEDKLVGTIENVKKEVSENMKSATDWQDKVEAEHVAMKNDISDLITKVEGIKKIVEGPQDRRGSRSKTSRPNRFSRSRGSRSFQTAGPTQK